MQPLLLVKVCVLLGVVVPKHVVLAFQVELQVLLTLTVSAATVIAVPAPTFNVAPPDEAPPVRPLPAVTDVISPVHVVKAVLLYALHPKISLKIFLLSAPLSRRISSSCVVQIPPVISVSSHRSRLRLIVPEEVIVPAPSNPAAVFTVILVTVPVHVVLAFQVELHVLFTPTVSAATVIAVPAPTFNVAAPDEAPPVRPFPAVTAVISPVPVHDVAPHAIPSNLAPSLATFRPSTLPPKVILP